MPQPHACLVGAPRLLHIGLHGVVRTAEPHVQAWHRDLPFLVGNDRGRMAFSVFFPLDPCPAQDASAGAWVLASHRGVPHPWIEVAFAEWEGSLTILNSFTVHRGGGRSDACVGPARHVAFASVYFLGSAPFRSGLESVPIERLITIATGRCTHRHGHRDEGTLLIITRPWWDV